jgi:dimeric dUTPase (all-alpha-NTP-PPase superfamily)
LTLSRKNFKQGSVVENLPGGKDRLAHLFELQKDFGLRIGMDGENLTEEEQQRWVLNYSRAMQQEIAELVDSVPWKWWANYQKFDRQNAKVEVVDILHFLIATALALGMSAEDIYRAFLAKNRVNHLRQDSGYIQKNGEDSRHI